MPENDTNAPRSRHRRASSAPAGEAVEHRPLGHALGGEHVERVVPRLAGVDHQGQAVAVGEGDLGGERLALRLSRRVVVVVVEAALADGDDLRLRRQEVVDEVDAVLGFVGVHADGGEHVVEAGGDRRSPSASVSSRSRP